MAGKKYMISLYERRQGGIHLLTISNLEISYKHDTDTSGKEIQGRRMV